MYGFQLPSLISSNFFVTHRDKFNIFKSVLSLLDCNNTLMDVEILFHNVPCYINIVLQWHTDILVEFIAIKLVSVRVYSLANQF